MPGVCPMLRPPSARGASCARTLLAALEDVKLRPQVIHVGGVSEAELSMDFDVLAEGLPDGARIYLIGPDMAGASMGPAAGELSGPERRGRLEIFLFGQTYQRFMAVCHDLEAPDFVALFHPGLDIHYFSWYPCLRHWAQSRVPVLVTAFSMPDGVGETPGVVEALLEALVGGGGGAGMWIKELENPHGADGGFNAAYFVLLGSQGDLPLLPEEMYFALFQALQGVGHPFAPRVGYLDVGEGVMPAPLDPSLLASIAEGAVRAAQCGEDGCDEGTAEGFAVAVLDQALGGGAGHAWKATRLARPRCGNCGDGFDREEWHLALCPAVGRFPLKAGGRVLLAGLQKAEFNGREGVLDRFDRQKQRWVVSLDGRPALFRAANLEPVGPDAVAAR